MCLPSVLGVEEEAGCVHGVGLEECLTIQYAMLLFSVKHLISALDGALGLTAQSFSNSVCHEIELQGFH